MIPMLTLAWHSARSRRFALVLTACSIMLSVALLLGVERIRHSAKDGFNAALSGTDLIVGPRSHPMQLLLYSVFHIGEPDAGMRWDSVQRIAADPAVAWTIPLSLGDSHRGFPVVATTRAYLEHYRYGRGRQLILTSGAPFQGLFDVVIGAEIARRLGYRVGDQVALSHGAGHAGEADHNDKLFTIVGILEATGTPVDRVLHIGLEAMEAIHLDWHGGAPIPGAAISQNDLHKFDLHPKQVTAVLIGLKQRAAAPRMQRLIATGMAEPLSAVLPGVGLRQLWDMTGTVERMLKTISFFVLVVALAGLSATVLAGLNERRRELAILRTVGAQPIHIFLLLVFEGLGVTLAGAVGGYVLVQCASLIVAHWSLQHWGLALDAFWPGSTEIWLLGVVLGAGLMASIIPAMRAYRISLMDGLAQKA